MKMTSLPDETRLSAAFPAAEPAAGPEVVLVPREKLERLFDILSLIYEKYRRRPVRQALDFVASLLGTVV